MTEKFQINPFDRSALTDYRQLAGRTDEFRQIRFVLRNALKSPNRIKSILITGERGVGKTSFLNLISEECNVNNLIPIRIDLTESNSSTSCDFFWHLFSQTINTLFDLSFFGGRGGAIDAMIQKILNSDGIVDQANWVFRTPILRKNFLINPNTNFEFNLFIDDLRLMRKHVIEKKDDRFNENTKLLFLVDESQHIYSNRKIIEELRFVIQSQDLGVGFVFAGDTTYKTSLWEQVFGGTYREFDVINLTYFKSSDDVADFFKKSLVSVGWTENEIEETLFYRYRLACRHIFNLTSGKPSWINTIASKMFERCMSGEVRQLKFDKQAQSNVKKMLEETGELDNVKLAFIENLNSKYEMWLAEIFACEVHQLKQVYFYSKFKLSSEKLLAINEFEKFCNDLVSNGIISFVEVEEDRSIGFKSQKRHIPFLDHYYYSFDLKADSIKQWLQISSDGKYSFMFEQPSKRFITFINDELVIEKGNTIVISHRPDSKGYAFRISKVVESINNKSFDVNEESFDNLSVLFKACKKLENSSNKEVLFVALRDLGLNTVLAWNSYNYNDKDKIISFRNSPSTIERIKNIVNSYKTPEHNYDIQIIIDKIVKPDLAALQSLIISSGDVKKIGIIIDDKMNDLFKFYVTEANIESSYEIATFFYSLFEEGYDLSVRELNNNAYVFIEKNELEKAEAMLNEAKRKITVSSLTKNELNTAVLVMYNLAILKIKSNNYEKGLNEFEQLIEFGEQKEVSDDFAAVLKLLTENELGEIEIIEVKEDNKNYSQIRCTEFGKINVQLLRKKLSKTT